MTSRIRPAPARPISQRSAYLALTISVLVFAFTAVSIKFTLAEGLAPTTITALRLLIAAGLLTPLILLKYRAELGGLTRLDIALVLAAGGWLSIHFVATISSLAYTSVLVNQVLISTSPLWSAVLEVTFLHEKLGRGIWIALMFALVGSTVIGLSGGDPASAAAAGYNHLLGGSIALMAAIAGAVYLTIGRKVRAKVSILPYIWMIYGVGGILTMAFVLATGTQVAGHSTEGYLWVLVLAVFPTLIGHSGLNYAVGLLPATIVGLIGQLVVVASAVAAFVLLQEVPLPGQLIGAGIVLIAVMMAIFARRRAGSHMPSLAVTPGSGEG
jgi:drug/metabolite transporter (DMT)-like permease